MTYDNWDRPSIISSKTGQVHSNDPSVIKATIAGLDHLNSDLDNDYIHLKDANFFNPTGERVGS